MAYRRGLVAAALTVVMLIAACTSSGDPKNNPSSSVTPTPTSSSTIVTSPVAPTSSSSSSASPVETTATIEQAAQAAWSKYWTVTLKLESIPEAKRPEAVAAVAVEPIYGELINAARAQAKAGLVGYGYVRSRPSWPTPPTPSAKTAIMGDCFDGSHAGSKIAKTGEVQTVGKERTNVRVTFTLGPGVVWRVHQIEYLKASC